MGLTASSPYTDFVANHWDVLIDWQQRIAAEGNFFVEKLRASKAKRVLDLATGTGFHSTLLAQAGFEVVSLDGSASMLMQAQQNAAKHGVRLVTQVADWRKLDAQSLGHFDAVICLGNSFTHLLNPVEHLPVLSQIYRLLNAGGIFIVDHRNYDEILKNNFRNNHICYFGADVSIKHYDKKAVVFHYQFPDAAEFDLTMFPLRLSYMKRLLQQAGFSFINSYSDFQQNYNESALISWYTHIAQKQ